MRYLHLRRFKEALVQHAACHLHLRFSWQLVGGTCGGWRVAEALLWRACPFHDKASAGQVKLAVSAGAQGTSPVQ